MWGTLQWFRVTQAFPKKAQGQGHVENGFCRTCYKECLKVLGLGLGVRALGSE